MRDEHDSRSVWEIAYQHIPSKTLRMMLSHAEVLGRPERLAAVKKLLSESRTRRIRVRRGNYMKAPL